MDVEDRIAADQQGIDLVLAKRRKRDFDPLLITGFQKAEPESQSLRCRVDVRRLLPPLWCSGIGQGRDSRRVRDNLTQ